MRSHFTKSTGTAMAFAVTGVTAIMTSVCSGQVLALDTATDPAYSSGWSAGQNGGHGFGAWSFNGTQTPPSGTYQTKSSSSSLGTAWTLLSPNGGEIANAGRSIIGGLQAGQSFQTVIQNPVNSLGYFTYGGFDILFTSGSDNNGPGVNDAALRLSVFDYYNAAMNWHINDTGSHGTTTSAITTGASAMIVNLTLLSSTAYTLTLAPQSNPTSPYLTFSGTLASPIDYVDFRDYNTASSGPNDTANNFNIGSMEVDVVPEPATLSLLGMGALGLVLFRRRK